MQIRLYLAYAHGLRPTLETKPPPECSRADQKQGKNKNLYKIFFGGGVTIYIYLLPPMSLFVTNFGCRPLPHLNGPLFYSAISEVNCILTFFYFDYYGFFGFYIYSFVPHIFYHNQFYRLR